jgi:hypothetical protein
MAITTTFTASTEADLNAAIAAISIGGSSSAIGTAYTIIITSDLTLNTNLAAINLAAGSTLTIQGSNAGNDALTAQLDGDGTRSGFVVNAGSVDLVNMSLVGMTAPGGAGGSPAGGGALYVGAGAAVATSAVTFSGDTAKGGTPAGGAIFVAQGGTLDVSGGSVGGSGSAAGNGIFIQGNDSVTLTNTTVTGVIADQTGAKLGSGAGAVIIQGAVTLGAANHYTGGTQIGGSLSLMAAGAAGAGPISFAAPSGETLIIGAGDAPANLIDGFVPNAAAGHVNGDTIDLMGIGSPVGYALSATNQLTVSGSQGAVTLNLDPTQNFAADAFVLTADSGIGAAAGTTVSVVQSGFLVANETDLNAALSSIDVSGKWSLPNITYTITLAASFSLSTDLDAIDLQSGDTLTIDGAGNTIDGAGAHRGFFDYAGGLILKNLTIQNAVAVGGAGGSGATPGGGGAGLGGGLFVGSAGAASLSNVTFINDQAVGGAAGATGGTGVGGGGGLGGAGGAGGTRAAGGGGIGLAATGGSSGGVMAGGAGIVVGAAAGNSGTGNRPSGGSGGIFGGGGGAAGIIVTTGSGRGGGGSRTYPGVAGAGGVGGSFGGGAASGGAAGFGGGGANSAGGWGGGGSGVAAGGFGGGAGAAGSAGGGLGAGGDVFVQQGGSLTVAGGTLTGGSAAGGKGSGGGSSGTAFGSGIFFQGPGALALAPASGQTLSVGDVIADRAGSGSTGAVGVTLNGAGTVVLSAADTYTGGTTIAAGTLSLQSAHAAGSGMIAFSYGAAATLVIGAGDVPGNIIGGFLPGDVIDLQGIGTATSAIPDANNVLTVSGGTSTVQLALDPGQNLTGESFVTATDHNGGTLLTAVDVVGDFPPSISGTGTVIGDDHTPLNPLAGVTVSDLDPGQTETVTVTLSSPQNGVLSNLSAGVYDAVHGVYTVSGSAAAVTAALKALVFTPTVHQVAPGQTTTTVFDLSATDGLMFSTAAETTVDITALNDPPVISGVGGALVEGYWNVPLNPFAAGAVTDPDVGATETVTFWLSSANGATGVLSLSLPGFTLTHTSVGTYVLSAASPADVSRAIEALQFTAAPNPAVPGYTITYVNMSVSDGIAPPVTADAEVLTGLPIFSGVMPNQTVTDGQSISPFNSVAITDSAGLSIQGLTITLFDSSSNYLNPTDANGTLSGGNLVKTGVGTYTLTPGSTQSVTAELDALVFTPSIGNSTTTYFNLSAFDGATTADNQDTSVIAVPGPPPAPTIVTAAMNGDNTLTLGGAALPNGEVDLYEDATLVASPNVASYGSWSFTTLPLDGARHTFVVYPAGKAQPASNNLVVGTTGGDVLYSSQSTADILLGRGMNDIFVVYDPADTVIGQPGSSDAVYAEGDYTLPINVDTLFLFGSQGAGNSDATGDALYAVNAGITQTLTGNSANDTFVVYNSSDVVVPNPGSHDVVYAAVDYALPGGVDTLYLTGAGTQGVGNSDAAGDTLTAANSALAATLIGNSANDTFVVYDSSDVVVPKAGSHDVVYAAVDYTLPSGVDTLYLEASATSGTGNSDATGDMLVAANPSVAATLTGNSAADTFVVYNSSDVVVPMAGSHDVVYAAVDYTLPSGIDTLIIEGSATSGTGNSDAAGDLLVAASSSVAATLTGNSRNDSFGVYNSADTVIGLAGSNDVVYAAADFTLPTNVDTLFLEGNAKLGTGNGDAANALYGNAGLASTLVAGSGTDILSVTGSAGTVLTGGAGADTFAFPDVMGSDEITNFDTTKDTLQFNASLFVNFAAAMAVASPSGVNTVFSIGANDQVILDNVAMSSLSAANFRFS